jgi:DNA-binding phage protein
MPTWPITKKFDLELDLTVIENSKLNINQICTEAKIGSQIFYRSKSSGRMPKLDTIAKFIFAANDLDLHIGFDDILKIKEK